MHLHAHEIPLARFAAVDTKSPDEARQEIGRIFCPHFLFPAERRPERFHARHRCAPQAGYSVNYVAYGSTVEIDPGELSRFFLLQVPIEGSAEVRCGASLAEASAGVTASILSPTLPTRMTWREGCEKIIILMERKAVEDQFAALTGRACDRIEFSAEIDLTGATGRALLRHVALMLAAAEEPEPTPQAYQATLRDGLSTLLLTAFAHSGAGQLAQPAPTPAPGAVRRAELFIAGAADRPIAMAEVAEAAGVCLRSLQEAFKRTRGVTLSQAVQNARLERFRAQLCTPGGADSVAAIAFAAGLGHLGRAAAAYRARYGETPSQTLRRRG